MNSGKEQYFQHVRTELIEEIPIGNHRILEVGCAEGSTCAALKSKGCATVVVGIELDPVAATSAEQKLDHVVCGDIETLTLHKPWFAEESFDYIICGDVLEHLRDPWGQLDRILKLLAPGGKLIISLPNIRYYGVTFPLIFRDEWTYTDSGILDSTHYRFFTKSTSIQMLLSAGLVNISYNSIIHKRRDRLLNLVSFGLLTGLVTPQWVLTGTKTPK